MDKYAMFDNIVSVTLVNIYSLSKVSGSIILENFDPKNKEHLYFLNVAMLARDVFGFPIKVKLGWFKTFMLNLKLHRKIMKVKRAKAYENGIKVPEVLDYMRPLFEDADEYGYASIYEAYYKRGRELFRK